MYEAALPTPVGTSFSVVCCLGGGAGAHAEEGVKTGRQADPDYKRTGSDAAQGSKPPAPTAGFAGEWDGGSSGC